MLKRTEGVVLKTHPYGEADLIVTHFTRDYGITKSFAKSPRKVGSRFGSSLEPLTHAAIAFWGKEDAQLPRLTQSDIIHPFHDLRSSFSCFLSVSELLELIISFLPEGDRSVRLYDLLLRALHLMEHDCSEELLMLHFKIKVLDLVGYLPHLHSCCRCGGKGNSFYVDHGAILCERCSQGQRSAVAISAGAFSLFASLLSWESQNVKRIRPSKTLVSELAALINEHIKFTAERRMKTASFKSTNG